jgi:hypothetical protein
MIDFLGTILTAALMMVVVNALVTYLKIRRSAKLALAGIAGVWIGLAAAAAASGWLATSKPFPVIGIFVATPLITAAIATAWPGVRAALLKLPIALMIGLNIGRVFAVLFLLLGAQGRLAGPFPFFAGWGDIITGVLAVPLLFAAVDTKHTSTITAWNLFGAADLVLAILLGVTSAEGSPLQLFYSSPGSAAMQHLPWAFVPTVLVPCYLIMHAAIWAQLRGRGAGAHNAIRVSHRTT